MVDFPGLVHCRKSIAYFPGWSPPEAETGFRFFLAPLEIGGVVEDGFNLCGGCYSNYPDANVVFELILSRTPTRRRTVLERIEWRSLQGGHSNMRNRPEGVPRRTQATHWHKFELNYNPSSRRMLGDNLPVAQNINERLLTFDTVTNFVGNRLNIENVGVVLVPEWEYTLFHDDRRIPNDE